MWKEHLVDVVAVGKVFASPSAHIFRCHPGGGQRRGRGILYGNYARTT
jgi:hypothetical protein